MLESSGMTTDLGSDLLPKKGIGSGGRGTISSEVFDFLPLLLACSVRMGQARDWSAFLSEESKAREPSPLKAVANHLSIPGIISLGGGYIPFHSGVRKLMKIVFRIQDTFLLNMSMSEFRPRRNSKNSISQKMDPQFALSRIEIICIRN